jgi:hypothetical protein
MVMDSTPDQNSSWIYSIRAMVYPDRITHRRSLSGMPQYFTTCRFLVWFILSVLLCGNQSAYAIDIKGALTLNVFNMTGENSYTSSFDGGKSILKWPIDMKTAGINLLLSGDDLVEIEIELMTEPWGQNAAPMKDYDYIDESRYTGRPTHEGVDIYSESTLDSRALIFGVHSRVFPYRTKDLSAGVSVGYEYQEFDYRAYNTHQVGFGSWDDQSSIVTGPVSFYALDYDIYSLGLVVRPVIEDVLTITLDASVLPYVVSNDEDEHLRRSRISISSCKGSGYQTSLSTAFRTSENWFISTQCSLRKIHINGHTSQYWYGDDPATIHYDDTGQTLANIDTKIDQDTFRLAIGATYQF